MEGGVGFSVSQHLGRVADSERKEGRGVGERQRERSKGQGQKGRGRERKGGRIRRKASETV